MKKLLLLLLLAPVMVLAQSGSKGFTIDGKLDGYTDGTKISLYRNGDQVEWMTTKLDKGKFSFKNKLDEPILCFIVIDGVPKPIEVFMDNANVTVKGNKSNVDKYDISGSKYQADFQQFIDAFLPLAQQISTLASSINNTMPGAEKDGMMNTYNGLQANMQKEIDKFIASKPRSLVSPFVLDITYSFNEDVMMLEKRFKSLDASIRKSATGKKIEDMIEEKKIGAVGTQAIDFTQTDTTGTPVSLSSFRGKYVLLDFWASWCGPCRQENPNVVENYNKFHGKNFTVLSVSLDRPGQKDKWLEAIHTDGLTWTHVSDLQFWNNAVAKTYKINSIPQNILIDPQGKIIGRNLRGPALQEKLCEVLGCN